MRENYEQRQTKSGGNRTIVSRSPALGAFVDCEASGLVFHRECKQRCRQIDNWWRQRGEDALSRWLKMRTCQRDGMPQAGQKPIRNTDITLGGGRAQKGKNMEKTGKQGARPFIKADSRPGCLRACVGGDYISMPCASQNMKRCWGRLIGHIGKTRRRVAVGQSSTCVPLGSIQDQIQRAYREASELSWLHGAAWLADGFVFVNSDAQKEEVWLISDDRGLHFCEMTTNSSGVHTAAISQERDFEDVRTKNFGNLPPVIT